MSESTNQEKTTGRCLCGAVEFAVALKNRDVGACHCGMCRRWTGGVFLALEYVGDVELTKGDALGIYPSSDWGERCFCKTCGTSLFWRLRGGGHGVVSAQALDGASDVRLANEIFYDEKPGYYSFAEPTHKMTGAEVMALFAPKPE